MRKKYLKGIVAGMMVGAVVLTNGHIVSAKTDEEWDLTRNFGYIYDGVDARNYALLYCGDKLGEIDTDGHNNSRFHDFVDKDCTNFVSQCVAKGGMVLVDDGKSLDNKVHSGSPIDWSAEKNSKGKWKATKSWVDCDAFDKYMRSERAVIGYRTENKEFIRKNAVVGDVIQFAVRKNGRDDITHSMIVTKVCNGEVFLTGHSKNRKNYPLADACTNTSNNHGGKAVMINLLKFTSVK